MVQGELFRDEHLVSSPSGEVTTSLFGRQITVTLDKVLLVAIAILVVFALTYSLGVERGKRLMEGRLASLIPTHGETLSPFDRDRPASDVTGSEIVEEELVLIVEETEQEESGTSSGETRLDVKAKAADLPTADPARKSNFTVQLVTYVDLADAVREVHRLRSAGHESFVIPSGPYFQVCADYFTNRAHAKTTLDRFQASGRYPGAYIRPVVR